MECRNCERAIATGKYCPPCRRIAARGMVIGFAFAVFVALVVLYSWVILNSI